MKISILTAILAMFANALASPPRTPTFTYSGFNPKFYSIKSEFPSDWQRWPRTGYFGGVMESQNEPKSGYPFHNSMFTGISDTHTVRVHICNYSQSSYSLGTGEPESWFIPVVYHNLNDYINGLNLVDTSQFEFAFRNWGGMINKPDSLTAGSNYILEYDLWDLPKGLKGVDMIASVNKPTSFSVIKHAPSEYLYADAFDLKDSINAYTFIAERLLSRKAYTAALSWTNSIFALNDSSIAGWTVKGFVKMSSADTTSAIDAFDRVITIINNNNDPLFNLADTTLSREERAWANDRYNGAVFYKWILETKSKYVPK